ncbi:pentatricopeptide repeat-containing protein At5g61800 [Carica papaya]|uniref:pentatricopeptide repeat-containing protein At5g61800 n=1 Tax=Carica papaya TaxID=3649 RepID=UPI000B8C84B2|nr:pentatricopeptide repeat-containing protein At5g61800 [Carica papaya]
MLTRNQSILYLTINNLVKQCKTINQLHQLHAHTITTELLFLTPHVLTKILYTITNLASISTSPTSSLSSSSSTSLLSYALSVFTSIPNPSTFCYNAIIRLHIILSSPFPALRFFSHMRRISLPPDFHTFPFAFKACAQTRALSVAEMLHCQAFKFGFTSDLFVSNSLLRAYSISGNVKQAYTVFDESSHRDVVTYNSLIDSFVKAGEIIRARELFDCMPSRDAVSWGTLIAGYSQVNQCNEAIELFNQMIVSDFRPDNISLVAALSACARLGELEQGKAIHNYIKTNRIRVDSFLSTGLVDFYAKCGFIEIAMEIFESSLEKNVFTWNAMLTGLAMHGHGQVTLDYFSRMIDSGVKPDGISFLGVLVGCSHAGLVNEARKIFNEMETIHGIPRELKHYGCMADLLGRAGLIGEAMEMIKKMPMGGDVFVWSGVLGGCRIHGNVEIAEKAAEHVMELKPEDGGVYSVMASVYANVGRWEDVVKIRKSMDCKRVKRNAGWSSIKLNGIAHEFVAGDDLHPQTQEIYLVLNGITEHQLQA